MCMTAVGRMGGARVRPIRAGGWGGWEKHFYALKGQSSRNNVRIPMKIDTILILGVRV